MSELLLTASQKLPTIKYDEMEPEEVAELEVFERGVSIGIFRDQVSDIFLKTYFLLMKHFGQEGGNLVFQMVLTVLQEGQNDVFKAEVAIFGARSLLDGLDDDTYTPETLAFVGKLVEFFLSNENARTSFILAKSAILFIEQAAKILIEFKQHSSAIVNYLFTVFTSHSRLQVKTLDTLLELCTYCKYQFSSDVVSAMHSFLT